MALLLKLALDGSGPCDGSSSFSRIRFAWILIHRRTYQFTPNVTMVAIAENHVGARAEGRHAVRRDGP